MYKQILVAVDGSSASKRGLEEAIRLAQVTGGKLLLVHVVSELLSPDLAASAYYDQVLEAVREGGKKILEKAAAVVQQAGVPYEQKLVTGLGERPADLIVAEAKASGADLIALGTHGRRGLKRLALGSDAELVVRLSPVPVLLVREQPET
ncbi:MAG: universal stress protein [Gammaproteobacteria bacterium]|nr:universal stress protein [Gammaproteobacteria bacterium]